MAKFQFRYGHASHVKAYIHIMLCYWIFSCALTGSELADKLKLKSNSLLAVELLNSKTDPASHFVAILGRFTLASCSLCIRAILITSLNFLFSLCNIIIVYCSSIAF